MHARAIAFAAAVSLLLAGSGPAAAQGGDPPLLVGRIASVNGTVSYHLAGAERWERASVNLPLTDGAAVWTEPGSQAALGVGGNRIGLGASTEFELDRLDEQLLVATQAQGESYLHLRLLPPGDVYTVQTPRGIVAIATAGRYEVVSGDSEHPTEITVLDGAAKVTGIAVEVEIGPNQTLSIIGDGAATPFTPTLRAAAPDHFLKRMLAEERPAARRSPAPEAVGFMTGGEALEEYGEWGESAEYGPIWYPPAPGYVPYRDGRWAYVEPWGWTWVDSAPWGFAPTHYGRWAQIGRRWCWAPGRAWGPDRRPAYAPALVGFLAGAAAGPLVGWAPLGPREAYRPPYASSQRYREALNRSAGAAVGGAGPVTIVNRQAITIVPAQVLARSASVAAAARPGPAAMAGAAGPLRFRPQVAPTAATLGATRAALQRVNAPGASEPPPRAAPGPSIRRLPAGEPGEAGRPEAPHPTATAGVLGGVAAGALLRPAPRPDPGGLPGLRPRGGFRAGAPGSAVESGRPASSAVPASRPMPVVITPQQALRPGPATPAFMQLPTAPVGAGQIITPQVTQVPRPHPGTLRPGNLPRVVTPGPPPQAALPHVAPPREALPRGQYWPAPPQAAVARPVPPRPAAPPARPMAAPPREHSAPHGGGRPERRP